MRPSTLARLALSGTRTDTVRLVLTAFGAALATLGWLCAATVASLGLAREGPSDPRYTTDIIAQPGLRPGVVAAFILLTIPVLALVAQCARLGAPARDRRIAAMRLAGATPRQAIAIGAGESTVSALFGSIAGLAAYLVLRGVLDNPDAQGARPLPTDHLPPDWAIVVICTALPLLVGATTAHLLRRVTTSPLGVVRHGRRRRPPSLWPGLLMGTGIALFAVFTPLTRFLTRHHVTMPDAATITIFYAGVLCTALGVVLGAGWMAHATGIVLRRLGRRAPSQLAAARLVADPWQGSRAFGVLMVAAVFGGGTAAIYQNFVAMAAAHEASDRAFSVASGEPYVSTGPDSFYANTTLLVAIAVGLAIVIGGLGQLVSISEAVVSRRRTYAALVATGVPRSVLVRAQMWQTMTVAVPALALAAVVGMLLGRLLTGTTITEGGGSIEDAGTTIDIGAVTVPVAVPWPQLGLVVGGSIGAVLLTAGIGLLCLKSSTSIEELRTA